MIDTSRDAWWLHVDELCDAFFMKDEREIRRIMQHLRAMCEQAEREQESKIQGRVLEVQR